MTVDVLQLDFKSLFTSQTTPQLELSNTEYETGATKFLPMKRS